VGHQTRDIDYTRLNGGPISTEVLDAAGAAGVSDADICIVDDSKDRTEDSAKRTNPSDAVTRLKETRARAVERLQVIRDYLEWLPDDVPDSDEPAGGAGEIQWPTPLHQTKPVSAEDLMTAETAARRGQATSEVGRYTSAIQAPPRGQHP
jgi:hypothetical protein